MDNKTMVQPDIVVICKPSGFTKERAIGAPDFVIEILSQSTKNKDMRLKLKKYENAGVREYWIIGPDARTIIVYNFEQENLTGMYTFNGEVPVGIWNGKCKIDFNSITRALALHPDVLCFDEPTSALDPELTGEVLKVIRELADRNTTMIIVTHEMEFAKDVADKVIFMDCGVIVEQGSARQVIEDPQHERTKSFLAGYKKR